MAIKGWGSKPFWAWLSTPSTNRPLLLYLSNILCTSLPDSSASKQRSLASSTILDGGSALPQRHWKQNKVCCIQQPPPDTTESHWITIFTQPRFVTQLSTSHHFSSPSEAHLHIPYNCIHQVPCSRRVKNEHARARPLAMACVRVELKHYLATEVEYVYARGRETWTSDWFCASRRVKFTFIALSGFGVCANYASVILLLGFFRPGSLLVLAPRAYAYV